jgi:hypothetical protein
MKIRKQTAKESARQRARAMADKLSKEQLVGLVERIINAEGTEKEINEWVELFACSVPDPEASDLIFWPSTRGLGSNPSAEEIVEKALNYKPIHL